jgi:hypothetical protein
MNELSKCWIDQIKQMIAQDMLFIGKSRGENKQITLIRLVLQRTIFTTKLNCHAI